MERTAAIGTVTGSAFALLFAAAYWLLRKTTQHSARVSPYTTETSSSSSSASTYDASRDLSTIPEERTSQFSL
jgi:hypothetical protein